MGSGPYAIVVNVPEAERTCFIATPFNPAFARVSRLVTQAANSVGLQSIRTDEIQGALTFTDDIAARLRAASVVVAVCSPEPETNKPNPNVMYELGFAQSIGKPAVILTNDIATLPSDIRTQYVVVYDNQDIQDEGAPNFLLRMKDAFSERRQRMVNPLTDPFSPGVSVAYARHKMLLAPSFWDDFRHILSFAKQVHDQIQAIDAGHVDVLFKSVGEVYFASGSKRQKIGVFCDKWNDYSSYFIKVTQPNLFDKLPQTLDLISACFRRIASGADDETTGAIETARKFYDKTQELLVAYPSLHNALAASAGANLLLTLESPGAAKAIYGQVQALSNTSKPCVIQADRLIVNLIEMML